MSFFAPSISSIFGPIYSKTAPENLFVNGKCDLFLVNVFVLNFGFSIIFHSLFLEKLITKGGCFGYALNL